MALSTAHEGRARIKVSLVQVAGHHDKLVEVREEREREDETA